jgi:GntR family transcriptional regulator
MTALLNQGAVARPLYSQVRELMAERIEGGIWSIGSALPNEFELSADFGVSVGTIRRAVEGLEETGILIRKQGRGTFVAGSPASLRHARLYPFRVADGSLWEPNFDAPKLTRRSATRDEIKTMGHAGSDVIVLERFGRHKGNIVFEECAIIPVRVLPALAEPTASAKDFRKLQTEARLDVAKVVEALTASCASSEPRPAFPAGTPLLRIDRRILDSSDRLLEWGTSWLDTTHLRFAGER